MPLKTEVIGVAIIAGDIAGDTVVAFFTLHGVNDHHAFYCRGVVLIVLSKLIERVFGHRTVVRGVHSLKTVFLCRVDIQTDI